YVGTMTDKAAKALAKMPGVLAVAPDGVMKTAATAPSVQALSQHPGYAQLPALWGLDRIDQRGVKTDGLFHYNATGAGVTAYVVDTGVKSAHIEFGGRVRHDKHYDAYRAATDAAYGEDCDGHGTHVAGTIGGQTFGVAKQVSIVSVRVLDCTGYGLASNIVKGIDWMTADHQAGVPAVANMSFGGSANSAIDAAVQKAIADGITVVAAAGNGGVLGAGADACGSSPARVKDVITVGASDATDKKPSWSNYGSCVDVFAPGANIVSADGAGTDNAAWKQLSGTSMSSPHTAGVAALILSAVPTATPADIGKAVTDVATTGLPTGSKTTAPKLLYAPYDLAPNVLPAAGAPAPPPAPGPAPAPAPCSGFLACLLG
ncbi:MAG: S8 family peptidase, partial [Actinobacteria bacterium]|nr:S8 family peptidase [Actinomycetota bacterium]